MSECEKTFERLYTSRYDNVVLDENLVRGVEQTLLSLLNSTPTPQELQALGSVEEMNDVLAKHFHFVVCVLILFSMVSPAVLYRVMQGLSAEQIGTTTSLSPVMPRRIWRKRSDIAKPELKDTKGKKSPLTRRSLR